EIDQPGIRDENERASVGRERYPGIQNPHAIIAHPQPDAADGPHFTANPGPGYFSPAARVEIHPDPFRYWANYLWRNARSASYREGTDMVQFVVNHRASSKISRAGISSRPAIRPATARPLLRLILTASEQRLRHE